MAFGVHIIDPFHYAVLARIDIKAPFNRYPLLKRKSMFFWGGIIFIF